MLPGILSQQGAASFPPSTDISTPIEVETPYVMAYPWDHGFGTKYANPGTVADQNGKSTEFTTAGTDFAWVGNGTYTVMAYPWNPGYGTKYTQPSPAPGSGYGVTWTHADDYITVAHSGTPFFTTYPWSAGFGTKVTNAASLPATFCEKVDFHPDDSALAFSMGDSPYIVAYPWTGSAYGTKFSNPATLPDAFSAGAQGIKFSPDGADLAIAHYANSSAAAISVYPWTGSGYGTRYSDATDALTSSGGEAGVSWHPTGTKIAQSTGTSPMVAVFPWSAGFGTKYSNPATAFTNFVSGISFDRSGTDIAGRSNNTPYLSTYPWSAAGFGTRYSNPATLPGNSGNDVTFN